MREKTGVYDILEMIDEVKLSKNEKWQMGKEKTPKAKRIRGRPAMVRWYCEISKWNRDDKNNEHIKMDVGEAIGQ